MIRSLNTAALGMTAQQLNVDIIANNLANVNTTGYKKSAIEFQDLLYETIQSSNMDGREGRENPGQIQVGLGNKPISTFRSFSTGNIQETGNALDIAIEGKGFFQVEMPDGNFSYTRDGALKINGLGELVTNSGLKIAPDITVPENTSSISVSQNGIVSVVLSGQSESEEIGQIELVSFVNSGGLTALGGNLFQASDASGEPIYGVPGEESLGRLEQGYLEKSNVDVAQEMINLIVAQRAYEINSKVVRTADDLMSMTNNLKR
jgi:flagellar basal-body rod protein FlgG